MPAHLLDNPVWHSLTGAHASFSIGGELVKKYPSEIAPFLAIPESSDEAAQAIAAQLKPGDEHFVVGVAPPTHEGYALVEAPVPVQMVFTSTKVPPLMDIEPLRESEMEEMLALMTLAYPSFYRLRTPELGEYYGMRENGVLVSMAGLRMHPPGYREVSGVCTHPEYVGRGYAAQLVNHLVAVVCGRGEVPFLHVHPDNVRAVNLYERSGFAVRAEVRLWKLCTTPFSNIAKTKTS